MALHAQRPLADTFKLVYAGDPALDHDRPDFDAAYARALETLDFAPLIRAGEQPTWFVFSTPGMSAVRRVMDLTTSVRHHWLAVRMALRRVENFGEFIVEKAADPEYPKAGDLVTVACMDVLEAIPGALGRPAFELVNDFGACVLHRGMNIHPKS
jgi:hypothetical protein